MTECEPAIRPGKAEGIADLTEIYNHLRARDARHLRHPAVLDRAAAPLA